VIHPPEVVLVNGDDASGMACMLADLITDNLGDYPCRAAVAGLARGEVVFTTTDQGLSVTLSFLNGRLEIADGARSGAPVVASPWLTMAALCSGRASPVKARSDGDLTVMLNRQPIPLAAAAYVVSVPASHYGEPNHRTRNAAVSIGLVCLIALVVHNRRGRRPTNP